MALMSRIIRLFATAAMMAWMTPIAWADDDSADRDFQQAKQALTDDDVDRAVTLLDKAIRLAPERAKYRGLRGVAWLRKGNYASGLSDLREAIKLNPNDTGQVYHPSTSANLSAEALQHGRQQLAAMLRDRPAMAEHGPEAEFLRRWAIRKFAGEDLGSPIDWDPSPPWHSDAEHLAPEDDENAAILVAAAYDSGPERGKPRSFEELWAGAVYELINVNYAREFVRLNNEAEEGKISKHDFVAGILKYELLATQQTRAFYVQLFLPWAKTQKLPTDPTLWFCDWWDAPETMLQNVTDRSIYPWYPYARNHDWATVHRYWRQEDFARAIKLLEQMRTEEGYEDEQEDVDFWITRCRERMNKKHNEGTEDTKKKDQTS